MKSIVILFLLVLMFLPQASADSVASGYEDLMLGEYLLVEVSARESDTVHVFIIEELKPGTTDRKIVYDYYGDSNKTHSVRLNREDFNEGYHFLIVCDEEASGYIHNSCKGAGAIIIYEAAFLRKIPEGYHLDTTPLILMLAFLAIGTWTSGFLTAIIYARRPIKKGAE